MFERLFILFAIFITIYFLTKKLFLRSNISDKFLSFNIPDLNPSLPSILYFWTNQCAQCKVQKPDLIKLQEEGNGFNFVSFNAANEFQLVKELNIKTVPSTVVLNMNKEIKFINNGYTESSILKEQLKEIKN